MLTRTIVARNRRQCVRFLSSEKEKKVMITTPIYYVNASPHIGHLYSSVVADALSRWYRDVKGQETLFTTGTDEHGLKVQESASKQGYEPQPFCDRVSATFRSLFDQGNIKYDDYIRTTESRHRESVVALWNRLYEQGYIYMGKHEAWYSKSDETFLTDFQVEDRMDRETGDTIKISKESGHPVERVAEDNYKFKLSAFQDRLLQWLDQNPDAVYPPSHLVEVGGSIMFDEFASLKHCNRCGIQFKMVFKMYQCRG